MHKMRLQQAAHNVHITITGYYGNLLKESTDYYASQCQNLGTVLSQYKYVVYRISLNNGAGYFKISSNILSLLLKGVPLFLFQ